MSVYAIADLHLSLGVDKPMDIFPGWTDYIGRLENNWRRLVTQRDAVVIAGDISWGMTMEEAAADFAFIQSLPGQKYLLKGNHDYWWSTKKKMETFFSENSWDTLHIVHNNAYVLNEQYAVCGTRGWFYDAEADADKKVLLREVGRLRTSIEAARSTGKEPLVFLHYPPVYADALCDEIWQELHAHSITRCYYGHIHGAGIKRAVRGELDGIRLHLISCDAVGFTPVYVP